MHLTAQNQCFYSFHELKIKTRTEVSPIIIYYLAILWSNEKMFF